MQTFLMLAILLSLVARFDLASCFPRYEDRQSKVAYEYRNLRILFLLVKCIGLFLRGRAARKTSLFSNAGMSHCGLVVHRRCDRWIAYLGRILAASYKKEKSDRILLKRR